MTRTTRIRATAAGLVMNALFVGAGIAQAQQPSPPAAPPARDGRAMMPGGRPMMMRHGPRGQRGQRDQVAMLLDKQLALQLTAAQVDQLITIHEKGRQDAKPLIAKMMALMPKGRDGFRNMTAADRENLGTIRESLRELQWRQVSAASAVLNDDQKKIAARFTDHHRWGGRGRMGRMGPMGRMGDRGQRGRSDGKTDSTSGSH